MFGRVISGWDICARIEKVRKGETPETNFRPVNPVQIIDCGELKGEDKLTKETAEFLKNYAI